MDSSSFPPSVRLNAKWGPPGLRYVHPRQRLFRQLDNLKDTPCTWISSPGGYGKTCLVQSYLSCLDLPSLWYNLDESDSDIATFFNELSTGFMASGIGPLVGFSADIQSIARFAQYYFQQVSEYLDTRTILVLDDYQRAAPGSMLHEALAATVDMLPEQLRLIVLSRQAPPAPFARTQSHGRLVVLGNEDLSLTDDEAEGIADIVAETRIDKAAILGMLRKANGWAAGFIVLLKQLDPSAVNPDSINTLFRYFEYEVMHTATAEMRDFLWQTALLPNMNADMVGKLTGHVNAAGMLRNAAADNYFMYVSMKPDLVYRYHDLFRDYLLDYGKRHDIDQWRAVAAQAATILADRGEADAAADLFAELEDWGGLVQLLNSNGARLMQLGNDRTLSRWLALLPEAVRHDQPWLVFWNGCTHLTSEPTHARQILTQAYRLFSGADDRRGALLAWSLTCQTYWLAFDDMRPLGDWYKELDRLLPEPEPVLPPEIDGLVALGAFLCLIVTRPDDPKLDFWESRMVRVLESQQNTDLRAQVATLMMFHFVWTVGDRGRALMLRDSLRAIDSDKTVAPMTVVIARSWGDFSYEYGFGGSFSRCLEYLDAALVVSAQRGINLYDASLYGGITYCHLTADNTENARRSLLAMEQSLNPERTYDAGFFIFLRAWEAWLSGRYTDALDLSREQLRLAERFGMMHPWPMSQLAGAQIQTSLGNVSDALRLLAVIGRWTRATRSRIGYYIRGLLLAQIALESNQRNRVRRLLRITFRVGQIEGYLGPPFFRPETLSLLYAEALDAGIEAEYCRRVIRNRGLPAPRTMLSTELWPWRIRIYALGSFRLLINDTPYRVTGKSQQKPLELLMAIVALGGENISLNRLADMLWPDTEGDKATSNIKTTLNRLRKLLGGHDFLLVNAGKISLNRRYCWTDIWRFEELSRIIAELSRPRSKPHEHPSMSGWVDRMRTAYPLPLLDDVTDNWALSIRKHLHKRYERCSEQLVQLLDTANQPDAATAIRTSTVRLNNQV